MIQDTLRDVLKKSGRLLDRRPPPPKLFGRAKNCRPRNFYQNFLDVQLQAYFWHNLKNLKVGVAPPHGEIHVSS